MEGATMAQVYHRVRAMDFTPADRTATATTNLIAVKKGMRIIAVSIEKKVLSTTADTVSLRVASAGGGASAGLLGATDLSTGAVKDIVSGAGADLATSGGFLVTADSTLDAVYTAVGGGGTVTPTVRVGITWTLDPVVTGLSLG
jgi:hypothetical protein